MKTRTLLAAACLCLASAHGQTNEQKTAAYYNRAKSANDVAKLTWFFTQMPKGGDLHHHYSGAVYIETYLDWMKDQDMAVNYYTYKPQKGTDSFSATVDSVRQNAVLYRNLLSLWSTQDYSSYFHDQVPPDQHFFNTFGYFGSVSGNYKAGLAEIKKRALLENVQYIETMLGGVYIPIRSTTYNAPLYAHLQTRDENGLTQLFTDLKNSLDESVVKQAIDKYNTTLEAARQGIDDAGFAMRYQTYTSRNTDPSTIFIALYGAFRACAANPSIVGVNFVGPENGYIAMKDYWLHMQMFRYLKSLPEFRNIHVALHAGELAMGLVKPEDMTWHIHDALTIAGADRIGHGVDLPYETDAAEILGYMAANNKAIEINLTSNEFILGIKNERHPIRMYYDARVPMVISTDDPGVSRNNLSEQYTLLASRYTFTYPQIKALVFNSITYSFLPPDLKAKNRELLTKRFAEFEEKMSTNK